MAHETGKIRLDDLNWNTKGAYKAIDAYHQSKLANLMHGAALARRLPARSVHYHVTLILVLFGAYYKTRQNCRPDWVSGQKLIRDPSKLVTRWEISSKIN